MDPHDIYLDNLGGCNDDGYEPERDELDAEQTLAAPKCLPVGPTERLEQVIKSAAAQYAIHLRPQ